jgi:hypothetical protein
MTLTLSRTIGGCRTRACHRGAGSHLLVARGKRGADLHHAGSSARAKASISRRVSSFTGEGRIGHRVGVGVELALVPAAPSASVPPPSPTARRAVSTRAQRGLRDLGRMGVARHLALHRAQAEPLGGVVAGVFTRPSSKTSASDRRRSRNSSPSSAPSVAAAEASAPRLRRDACRMGERALTWRLRKAGTGKMIQVNFVLGETFLTNVLPVP